MVNNKYSSNIQYIDETDKENEINDFIKKYKKSYDIILNSIDIENFDKKELLHIFTMYSHRLNNKQLVEFFQKLFNKNDLDLFNSYLEILNNIDKTIVIYYKLLFAKENRDKISVEFINNIDKQVFEKIYYIMMYNKDNTDYSNIIDNDELLDTFLYKVYMLPYNQNSINISNFKKNNINKQIFDKNKSHILFDRTNNISFNILLSLLYERDNIKFTKMLNNLPNKFDISGIFLNFINNVKKNNKFNNIENLNTIISQLPSIKNIQSITTVCSNLNTLMEITDFNIEILINIIDKIGTTKQVRSQHAIKNLDKNPMYLALLILNGYKLYNVDSNVEKLYYIKKAMNNIDNFLNSDNINDNLKYKVLKMVKNSKIKEFYKNILFKTRDELNKSIDQLIKYKEFITDDMKIRLEENIIKPKNIKVSKELDI